jgi:hypothetical protein
MNRLFLVSTLLATLGAGSAYAQVWEDPTTLHIANDASGGPGTAPNLITSGNQFFIDQVSNSDTIVKPIWVVFAVPNDTGTLKITDVLDKNGDTGITFGPLADLGDFTSGKLTAFLSTHPDGVFTTDFNNVNFNNSIQFSSMLTEEVANESPSLGTINGFEIFVAPINQGLVKNDWLEVQGLFPRGTFIDAFGFNANDSKGYTTSDTNFGLVTANSSSVPEPSTWAMIALGFAGLGYAGYRGRRSAVAAAL